jgi:hypothetical protein
MRRSLLVLVLVLVAGAARADDWKPPKDGYLTEKMVLHYHSYLEAVAKAGDKPSRFLLQESEKAWLESSKVSTEEIQWTRPRVDRILRALVVSETKKEAWEKAIASAKERLAAREKKLAEVANDGKKDTDDAWAERDAAVEIETRATEQHELEEHDLEEALLRTRDAADRAPQGERKALWDKITDLQRRKNQAQDDKIEAARRRERAMRERQDLADKLSKDPKPVEYRKRLSDRNRAKREVETLEAISKEPKPDLSKLGDENVQVVERKSKELRKALAGLGEVIFSVE